MRDAVRRYLPVAAWLPRYRSEDFPGDLTAGAVVAIMLVPQSMAYALVAGLPPEVGLYASVAPLVLYAMFGTSPSMAVGPTALVSLLVVATVSRFSSDGSITAVAVAATLALLVGALQLLMGVLRLGFLVNLLSQPVVAGFTAAAVLMIGLSQVTHLFGISLPSGTRSFQVLPQLVSQWEVVSPATMAVGFGSLAVLWLFRSGLGPFLRSRGVPGRLADVIAKIGPLATIGLTGAATMLFDLRSHGVAVVGAVPPGLPPWRPPMVPLEIAGELILAALTIAFVAFMESISIAKTLAGKNRQAIEPNGELRAFGMANLAAAFTGGFPVSSGLSRSIVNHAAGARTGLASLGTATLVLATLLFFTPLFAFLPRASLAAVVLVAITGLVDVPGVRKLYRYSRTDFAAYVLTALIVFFVGVQAGVAIGVAAGLLLFLWRASHPHLAVLGRIAETEHFRNILNYPVETCPHVLAVRIDESLFFANAKFLEENLLRLAAAQPGIKELILVCSAVNAIDASALETLERLDEELRTAGVRFHLAEVKGPVMRRLERAGFVSRLGRERIHLSTYQAMRALGCCGGKLQETTLTP